MSIFSVDIPTVGNALIRIYKTPFSGKTGHETGRFIISHKNLKRLMGVKELDDRELNDLRKWLFQNGYVFAKLWQGENEFFSVVKMPLQRRYRQASRELVLAILEDQTESSQPQREEPEGESQMKAQGSLDEDDE